MAPKGKDGCKVYLFLKFCKFFTKSFLSEHRKCIFSKVQPSFRFYIEDGNDGWFLALLDVNKQFHVTNQHYAPRGMLKMARELTLVKFT